MLCAFACDRGFQGPSRLMIDAVRSREIFERQMNQRWSPSRHMLEEGGQGFCRFSDSRPLLLTVRGYC